MRNDWSIVILTFCVVAVILLAGLVATKEWLGRGLVSAIFYTLAGSGSMLLLRSVNVPPQWFSGGKVGFALGLTFMASAFIFGAASERAFRLPFLFSVGVTLVVLNVLAHLRP